MSAIPILLACHQLNIGGSERQLTETARALDRNRFEPHVAVFHAQGARMEELKKAGVSVLALPVRSFRDSSVLQGARLLRRYVKDHNIRLIHSFDVPLNVFTTFSFAIGRRPVILTSQRGHRSLTGAFYHRLSRFADDLTDGIVVNCDYMRRHLTDEEGVPPELIDICYNGIDLGQFAGGDAVREPGLIGTLCALRPEKDIATLISAFAVVKAVNPATRLLIVGSGPEHSSLVTHATQLGIADAVTFQPAVADVSGWFSRMEIFVLPSRSEAFSNSIMEAMASGACVVASDVGGNPELTGRNGERGRLFPAGDADALARTLIELLNDAEARGGIKRAARLWVEQELALPVAVARMAAIYEKRLKN